MTPAPANKDRCEVDLPPLWIDSNVPESDVDSSDSDFEPDDKLHSHHKSDSFEEAFVCEKVTKRESESPTPNMLAYTQTDTKTAVSTVAGSDSVRFQRPWV
ncbi:unnamed protein product [Cylicocyclus nassatus]|uniref:Uncharacterized protein n=1 Tax=Cylicocyclus nassatus TaxID=53992 RepID=A0AA36GWE8_CYLNA|nr:unnamed protein product [Cylicocyclus nassatus]